MESRLTTLKHIFLCGVFSLNCMGSTMPVSFLAFQDGIRPEHLGQSPFFEKVACSPGRDCQGTRLYLDGALYLQDMRDPAKPAWSYLTQVKPAGMDALKKVFGSLCRTRTPPERNANDAGSVTYRWKTDDCEKEVLITGVSYKHYEALEGITTTINTNLTPVLPK